MFLASKDEEDEEEPQVREASRPQMLFEQCSALMSHVSSRLCWKLAVVPAGRCRHSWHCATCREGEPDATIPRAAGGFVARLHLLTI